MTQQTQSNLLTLLDKPNIHFFFLQWNHLEDLPTQNFLVLTELSLHTTKVEQAGYIAAGHRALTVPIQTDAHPGQCSELESNVSL